VAKIAFPPLGGIEALCAIVEEGSLNKAAAALCLTQPAISQRISRLEHWYGVELFERRGGANPLLPSMKALRLYGKLKPFMNIDWGKQ
jgi:DNA-binding transcriptional LysR family regulator